jgi:dTMP kinase
LAKGIFITLEGGEGTGKSTQIRLLQQALAENGVNAVTTREPGGTDQAERIRNLLVQSDGGHFDPLTEALLLFAARREHLVKKIWPALEQGQWVISDRFADSTRAFQGYGMGLDMNVIEGLYQAVAGTFQPDLTFIFDIDPEVGLSRSLKRLADSALTEDRYERMGLPFHQRLRQGFLDLAKKFPARCVVIDAAQDVQAIHQQVMKVVEQRFGIHGKKTGNRE